MSAASQHSDSNTAQARRVRWALNPLARKRWNRFRNHKRGFWSLVIVVALYVMSLGSELISNDKPFYVRYEGNSYFPIFKFYPDDVFTGSGLQTRPDYKLIQQSPTFTASPENKMVFTLFRYGPYEIVKPESLSATERVDLTIRAKTRVASIYVDDTLNVTRAQSAALFLNDNEGGALGEVWRLPESLIHGIELRLANDPAPEVEVVVTNRADPELTAEIRMRAFKSRSKAPRDVRLTFREVNEDAKNRNTYSFNRDLEHINPANSFWGSLGAEDQTRLLDQVRQSFEGKSDSVTFTFDGQKYMSQARLHEVRWPYRPVAGHLMGIDSAGRDVLARILYGLRTAMTFGLLLVTASMGLGIIVGALQGYYGGKTDLLGQRFIEIWSTIPFLYVMILLGSIYGRSFSLLLFCYGLFNWIGISYYVRAEFFRLRNTPFVDAARCLGIKPQRIMFKHILPNALTPIITLLPFSLAGAIGSLAILDYLGFGLPPPTPSWGELLQQAQQFRWAWWLITYPTVALLAIILLVALIGEAIRDAYDPKPVIRME